MSEATAFDRPGAGPYGTCTPAGDALYFIADQRTPLGLPELWRINSDGTSGFVYSSARHPVVDLAAVGDRVWFVTRDEVTSKHVLWTFAEGEAARQVRLGRAGEEVASIQEEDGRLVAILWDNAGASRAVALLEDGTTRMISKKLEGSFSELEWFDGAWSAVGFHDRLLRIELDGSFVRIGNLPAVSNHGISELTAVGDTLYFKANGKVSEGFGGFELRPMMWQMDTDEVVIRVSGLPSAREYFGVTGFLMEVSLMAPNRHVLATSGADTLVGSWRAERMVGGAGDDLLVAGMGNATLVGGSGDDLLKGRKGNDVFVFGEDFGRDEISGFQGGDLIDLTALHLAFSDLDISRAARGRILVEIGEDSILLTGVTLASVTEDRFLF